LVVGWQNKHDEGKEGTAGGEDREVEISEIRIFQSNTEERKIRNRNSQSHGRKELKIELKI